MTTERPIAALAAALFPPEWRRWQRLAFALGALSNLSTWWFIRMT